jgi:hypothetical protein
MPDYSFDDLMNFQKSGGTDLQRVRPSVEGEAPKTPEDIRREAAQAGQKSMALKAYQADVAQGEAQNAKNKSTYGTTNPEAIRALDMPGSPLIDPDAFKLLSAAHPEEATRILDSIDKSSGRGPTSAEPIRRGTQTTEHGDIPYFTNLPGAAGDVGGPMAGVRDLAPYAPGGSPNPGNAHDPLAGITDPEERAVARKIADAREQVTYGPKTPEFIGRKVAEGLPQALEDLKTLGDEGAAAKNMKLVEQGKMSFAVAEALSMQTKDAASKQAEAGYAQNEKNYFDVARARGVTTALDLLNQNEQSGLHTPSEARRLEAQLTSKAKSQLSTDAATTPDLFLPATIADAVNWKWSYPLPEHITYPGGAGGRAPDEGLPRGVPMPSRPASLINPNGQGPSPQEVTGKKVAQSSQDLISTVTGPDQVGKPARTAFSYTIPKETSISQPFGFDSSPEAVKAATSGGFWHSGKSGGEGSHILPEGSGGLQDELELLVSGMGGRTPEGAGTRMARLRREAAQRAAREGK